MKKSALILLLILAGCFLSGCAGMKIGPEQSFFGAGKVTSALADQMFYDNFEAFNDEQLFQLLDPENKSLPYKRDSENKPLTNKKEFKDLDPSEKIQCLRMAFRIANSDPIYGIAHRSQIQDRLIAALNQRCNVYATYLKRINSYQNGIFGTLTTILGGAGAIVTGDTAPRILSGLAGISSGTRAELNQAIFESITTSVIIPGIQKTRSALLKEMLNKRTKDLSEYTIEGAIADAIEYHGACSMDTGISCAQKSIQSFDDVGIKKLNEFINKPGTTKNP